MGEHRRRHSRPRAPWSAAGLVGGAGLALIAATTLLVLPSQRASADPTTLCGGQAASVAGGAYVVENDEYNSGANECLTTDGGADFAIANSDMTNPPGAPGGYPSIYQGCHWGNCSAGPLGTAPIQVANLTPGEVTTSWSTTQPGGTANTYDVAYDIWFNQTAKTNGSPNCAEVMVWLGHDGTVQPYGATVATNVVIGGGSYTVFEGVQTTTPTVSYELTTPATSVSDMDLYPIARDAVSRGYMSNSCYLISVEAGFELWQGGVGLATNSFSVAVDSGGTGTPSPSPTPSSTPTPSPSQSPSPITTGTGVVPTPSPITTGTGVTPSPSAPPPPTPSPSPSSSPAPTPTTIPSCPAQAPPKPIVCVTLDP
jgi:cellulose 1,4-beta-cellobiosidase